MFLKEMMDRYKNVPISDLDKLREILQQCALLGLYRTHFFKHAAFYGGTALRILFGLERFSEDLDFSLFEKNAHFDFEPFLNGLQQEMLAMGFDVSVEEKEKTHQSGTLSAFLKTNTLNLLLQIREHNKVWNLHPDQKLKIKIEIDTDPPLGFRTVSALVKEPTPFQIVTYHLSDLFAGKMHAILYRAWKNRVKGRDWFDLIWFIQKGTPLNLSHLQERIKHTDEPPLKDEEDLSRRLREKITHIDWELAKKDVRSFVTDPRLIEPWSASFFTSLIEHLTFEKTTIA
jgi:predicted nucleotidyltransferase component of viral defense system